MAIFFFFSDTATTEIYTLSLHDALPICSTRLPTQLGLLTGGWTRHEAAETFRFERSEEHTSELQSPDHLVCRLLLEKKKCVTCDEATIRGHGIGLQTSPESAREWTVCAV